MKRLATLLVFLTVWGITPSAVNAQEYGVCKDAISEDWARLIAPVQPIVSVTEVSPEILVMLVRDSMLADSVIPVQQAYFSEIHFALKHYGNSEGAWIGVVEGTDGAGDPALWMRVWANTPNGCVVSQVGDRVYERRGNAPSVYWMSIRVWEDSHPESALVHAKSLVPAE